MRSLQAFGFMDIVLCVGYRAKDIRLRYQDGADQGLRITYSMEKKHLGTAGAIKNAESLLQAETFLVLNGDSFVDADLTRLVQFHRRCRAIATLALVPSLSGSRFGSVRVDDSGKVLGFVEKYSSDASRSRQISMWINGGVYVFQKALLDRISPGRPVSLERDVFPKLVGQRFFGFSSNSYFIDIGVPEDYVRAQKEFQERFVQ